MSSLRGTPIRWLVRQIRVPPRAMRHEPLRAARTPWRIDGPARTIDANASPISSGLRWICPRARRKRASSRLVPAPRRRIAGPPHRIDRPPTWRPFCNGGSLHVGARRAPIRRELTLEPGARITERARSTDERRERAPADARSTLDRTRRVLLRGESIAMHARRTRKRVESTTHRGESPHHRRESTPHRAECAPVRGGFANERGGCANERGGEAIARPAARSQVGPTVTNSAREGMLGA